MRKLFDKLTKDSFFLKGTIGVFLCLLAIFGALNTGIVSNFFTWIISFFFGWFFYAFYLIMFLIGLKLIFARKEFKLHWSITIFGIIILLIGVLILSTNSMTNTETEYLTFKNFFEKFSASIQGFPYINYNIISGGFFGYLFVAILNSGLTYIGTQVVGAILTCAGFVLALIKTIIRLIKNIQDYKNSKIKKVESDFKMANDQKAFDTSDIIGSTRTTTVITPDSVIANKEHTQSIAIQNPNGGVGVGLTSINVQPTGLGKAKFNPNKFYETTNQTTSLATNKETSNNAAINPTTVANVQPVITSAPAEIIPLANKAVFQDKPSLDPAIINKASEKSEFVDVNEMKVINNADTVKAKAKTGKYVYPPIDLLSDRTIDKDEKQNKEVCDARVETINACLNDFKIGAQVVSYTIGPAVTRFDLKMNSNESCKVVDKYVDDISSRLNGVPCRFVQIVPGKTTSGIEIANKKASIVNFKDLLEHLEKEKADGMMIPFGKSISGDYIEADFTDFPHLLVCGTTGSGKSIFMHSLLMTLMMRNKLSDIRFIIIDPKRVEFGKYDKCPFLLCPPISDEIEANYVLQALVDVMEERYDMLLAAGLENVKQYNKYAIDHNIDIFPRIVVVIDEYADLVNSNKTISDSVVRLAQKARAAGIHLIISTQNPSVNIITGTIKANIPVRVALLCSSYTHSITILGTAGAEKLLGRGDMIVRCSFVSKNGDIRVQGAFVDNTEIRNVLDFIKANNQCDYDERFCDLKEKARLSTDEMKTVSYDKASSDEEKYQQIRDDIMSREYCSISFIQRSYGVGFPRAGKIFERLVSDGVISPSDEAGSNRGRKVILRNNSGSNAPKGSIEQSTFTADKKG